MEAYQEFEQAWGEWSETRNVVGCASGSAALLLAFEALQLPQGSEVLMPDLCMVACARAVVMAGLVPVFVDCGPDLNIDALLLQGAVTENTSAILAVHTYGRRVDMEEVSRRLSSNGTYLYVVEDLAEAHGIHPHTETNAACWSFYKNKVIAGEEGGVVAFDRDLWAERARSLRIHGFTPAHDFRHIPRGWNHRLSNTHAELIMWGMEQYEYNLRLRREQELAYDAVCPVMWRQPYRQVPWVYDIRVHGMGWELQERVVRELNQMGVVARCCFKPCTVQPEFKTCRWVRRKGLHTSNAEVASQECFYLSLLPAPKVTAREVFDVVVKMVDG